MDKKNIEIPEGYAARIEGNKVILEPKASVDERIRSFLYEFIKVCDWSEKQYPPREKCLAYLERQKEQKTTEDWSEKRKKECPFRRNLDNNLYGCERYKGVVYACDGNCSWVVDYPKLKEIQDKRERKPEEWSEEDGTKLYRIMETLLADKRIVRQENPQHYDVLCEAYDELISWLKSLPERFNLQPKNEWSEEDSRNYEYLHQIICNFINNPQIEYKEREKASKELIPFWERLKAIGPQPKVEWSEENKRKLNRIYEILGQAAEERPFGSSKRIIGDKEEVELQDFIKSLRSQPKEQYVEKYPEDKSFEDEWKDYYNNSLVSRLPKNKRQVAEHFYWFSKKNAWKPSEEQMKALQCAIVFKEIRKASDDDISPLKELYKRLKELI